MGQIRQLISKQYSDVAYVEAITRRDNKVINVLFSNCSLYFHEHKYGVLFAPESEMDRIFLESFETMWENIERGKIYVEDGELKGHGGKPFIGQLTTYLMSIVKFKFKEYVREKEFVNLDLLKHNKDGKGDTFENRSNSNNDITEEYLYSEEDITMYDVVAMCIAEMSERCSQILTKFYYDDKDYDVIMKELPTFTSKNALKTAKNKCMDKLHVSANSMWKNYLNS